MVRFMPPPSGSGVTVKAANGQEKVNVGGAGDGVYEYEDAVNVNGSFDVNSNGIKSTSNGDVNENGDATGVSGGVVTIV